MKYDYLIVGAGLFGSVFAREMTDAGARCLVIDKRMHIGGNCYTTEERGIHVHEYGPHIFHTDNKKIWDYANKWANFNHFSYRPKVKYKDQLYSFPINMMTFHQLWGVKTPEEAQKKLEEVRVKIKSPSNAEEWLLSKVGKEIYQKFFYGYTKKQWNTEPSNLPSFIVKRLPIRMTFDDNAYTHRYQGIPIGGYTQIFKKLLKGISLETGADYLRERDFFDNRFKKIVYCGPIDEFFENELGSLEWRSLRFEKEVFENTDYQGSAGINYSEVEIPHTRIIEHKHFEFKKHKHTVITKEYPQDWDKSKEKFYPINNEKNNNLFLQYKKKVNNNKYILGGRLADYKYYDMHQVIGSALEKSKREINAT